MVVLVLYLLQAISFVVIADAVLSWIQAPSAFPRTLTRQLTAPLYAPVHAVLKPEKLGGLDVSPIVILLLLQVIAGALSG